MLEYDLWYRMEAVFVVPRVEKAILSILKPCSRATYCKTLQLALAWMH